jgi:hypothetical protein
MNQLSLSNDTSVRTDIAIYDDSSIGADVLGLTLTYGQDCGLCLNQIDECNGACLNAQAVFFLDIKLNTSEITTYAGYYGTSPSALAALTVEHELGHALRLGHAPATNGICSEVQSVMYESASPLYFCGATTNACDASGVNIVYPGAVGYCSSSTINYCTGRGCT